MSNNILTIDMITRKALEILENNLVLSRNANKQYDSSFAQTGAKIGDSLRVRMPNRYLVQEGAPLGVNTDTNEQSRNVTITNQSHVDVSFSSAEMTLELDDFADRILKPAMSQLAARIDSGVADLYKDIFHSVGTPGATPSTSAVLLAAQQKLNEAAAPMNSRFAVVNPAANAGLVEGLKGLFNPGDVISRQFKSGMMGTDVLGLEEISMSQSIKSQLTGTRSATPGAITVTTTVVTEGASSIALTASAGATINRGEVFTVDGVFAVNPQTRETTGSLQQFVVTADATADGGGLVTVNVAPAIYTATHALATVTAFPQAGAIVTFMGAASSSYPQNLVYHKDALVLATADLLMPGGVDMASRQTHNGISMRVVRQYDINNDVLPCRIDVLWGATALRPETAARLWG